MSIWWRRGELNSPKIIFSRWFWNIWTVSVRNGESRIHAVDGETACQRAVKRRFFRFGYKLATWSQALGGLQPRGFEAREAGIKRLEKYLFAVLIIAYRREFVKFRTVLRIADVPLAPPFIAGEMRVDGMAAGRFGYRRLQGLNFVQRQNKKSGKIHLFNLTFLHFYYKINTIFVSQILREGI